MYYSHRTTFHEGVQAHMTLGQQREAMFASL